MSDDDEGFSTAGVLHTGLSFGSLVASHANVVDRIATCDPGILTSVVGGLLTSPDWQASTLRLEVLQHLVLTTARGKSSPSASDLKFWLTEIGQGYAGWMEDPSEDVFAARVLFDGQNLVVLEGLYESGTFYLQRFLDVLTDMPDEEPFASVRGAVAALLRLSDEIAKRSGLVPFVVGATIPLQTIPIKLFRPVAALGRRARFTAEELAGLGISLDALAPFVFDLAHTDVIQSELLGHSGLERRPLIFLDGAIVFALPSAVSAAIRRFMMEFCDSTGQLATLQSNYVKHLSQLFSDTPLAGGSFGPELPVQNVAGLVVANLAKYVDQGRLLHLCFVFDSFAGHAEGGLLVPGPDSKQFGQAVELSLRSIHRTANRHAHFKEAISLIVICSWGRPVSAGFAPLEDPRWRVELVSAPDFETMSWSKSFRPLSLWRLLDSRDRLRSMNFNVANINGLLNLISWSHDQNGHLVPHADVPDDHDPDQTIQFMIPQNGLLDLRKKTAESWNLHYARTWDGRTVRVRRNQDEAYFEEDKEQPFYMSVDDLLERSRLVGVYEAPRGNWWVTLVAGAGASRDLQYRLFQMLTVWLQRAAPILDSALPDLPRAPLVWIFQFESDDVSDIAAHTPDYNQASDLLEVNVQGNEIHVRAAHGFLHTFRNPENVAEKLLVEALIRGSNLIAGNPEHHGIDALRAQIVPNEWARQFHLFVARHFRDFVRASIPESPLLISDEDNAYSKLGLSRRAKQSSVGPWVRGIEECCALLNSVVDSLWEEMRLSLKRYNREQLIIRLFVNHEACAVATDQWLRTARAVLALHNDKDRAEAESTRQLAALNASSLGSRLLIEMALCESPAESGDPVGDLDLTRLIANALQMHMLGGWSEAVKYGGKEAEIKISPFGDLLSHAEFEQTVTAPYGQALGTKRLRLSAKRYEKNFRTADAAPTVESLIPRPFIEAWNETWGFSIDEMRFFLDLLENEGRRVDSFMFVRTESELAELDGASDLQSHVVARILDALTLRPREQWNSAPPGYAGKDWYPWRFRRRLSLIARPIVELPGTPVRYLIVPNLVRNSAMKVFAYCLQGGFEARDFPPGKMRSWIGAAENKRGHDFNELIASRLRELGWLTLNDVKLTTILNAKLDRDYGDVDVLAWKERRILIIECKDLELAMTDGDIARQIKEFRGDEVNGKPDRLRRHMNRFSLLQSRIGEVRRFTKSPPDAALEMCLVFSEVVPMTFTDLAHERNLRIVLAGDLDSL